MTRFHVTILPEAEAEFREAYQWYFERSSVAANAFRTEVFDKIDALAEDADTWPKDDIGVHCRILSPFPYTVHYDVVGSDVTVLAIAHQRRKPEYWARRSSGTGGLSGA